MFLNYTVRLESLRYVQDQVIYRYCDGTNGPFPNKTNF